MVLKLGSSGIVAPPGLGATVTLVGKSAGSATSDRVRGPTVGLVCPVVVVVRGVVGVDRPKNARIAVNSVMRNLRIIAKASYQYYQKK
jgi:hypothetical protein